MRDRKLSSRKHEKLLRRLRAPDEALRVHAALRLVGPDVDADRVRAALEQALADPDPHVRRLAGWVLGRLAPEQQVA
jgi:HEAT repeat protein